MMMRILVNKELDQPLYAQVRDGVLAALG